MKIKNGDRARVLDFGTHEKAWWNSASGLPWKAAVEKFGCIVTPKFGLVNPVTSFNRGSLYHLLLPDAATGTFKGYSYMPFHNAKLELWEKK
jgi:hypothetical protein